MVVLLTSHNDLRDGRYVKANIVSSNPCRNNCDMPKILYSAGQEITQIDL